MEILTIIEIVTMAEKFAGHFAIVEGAETKLDKVLSKLDVLSRSELKAGLDLFAASQESPHESVSLLRDARLCFSKAVHLENPPEQFVAYFGLAACHRLLGDETNAMRALAELTKIELKEPEVGILQQFIPVSGKSEDPHKRLKLLQGRVCRYLTKLGIPHKSRNWLVE